MEDIDIWRSAAILMKEHGAEAAMKTAASRAESFRLQGDVDGFTIWTQIILAVMTLERRAEEALPADAGDVPGRRPN